MKPSDLRRDALKQAAHDAYACYEAWSLTGDGEADMRRAMERLRALTEETNPRRIIRDGKPVWKLRCPNCGMWGDIDDDQLHGRASVDCPECPYHKTRNWIAALEVPA